MLAVAYIHGPAHEGFEGPYSKHKPDAGGLRSSAAIRESYPAEATSGPPASATPPSRPTADSSPPASPIGAQAVVVDLKCIPAAIATASPAGTEGSSSI